MFFIVLGLLTLLYSFIDFKNGYILYLLFEIIYYPNAKVIDIPGLPSLPISLFMSVSMAVIYFLMYRHRYNNNQPFPLLIPVILLAISRLITCFFSMEGFFPELSRSIGYIFSFCIELFIIWNVIDEQDDYTKIFRGCFWIFLFAGLYGLYEYSVKANPIFEYKSSLIQGGIEFYRADGERGYRLMSIFEHALGAGMNFGMYAIIAFYIIRNRLFIDKRKMFIFTLILALICVMLTKMRAGIVFTMIASLAFVRVGDLLNPKYIFPILLAGVLSYPLWQDSTTIFLSIFSSDAQEVVGGSNLDMRIEQLYTCLSVLKVSPIGGLGSQCLYLLNGAYSELRALESVFFEEMVKYGLLGVFSTLILIYYSVIKLPRFYHSREMFYLALAFWTTYTLTSIPLFRLHIYYLMYFYFLKNSRYYKA